MAPLRTRPLLIAGGAALLATLAGAAPAAANVIGPEPAHSPNAGDTNTLYWIGLVAAVALIVVVNGALLLAVTRYRVRRGVEPRRITSKRPVQLRVSGLLALFFAVLFVLSVIYTDRATDVPASGPNGLQASSSTSAQAGGSGSSAGGSAGHAAPLAITATGQQWLWRYTYPNKAFSYYRLVVPVDTTVKLTLASTDVVHSWYVPELGGKFDAVPGHNGTTWFRADRTGDYFGSSAQFSGSGYAAMRTEVSVVTPAQYTAFVQRLQREVQAAQDHVVKEIQQNGGPPGSPGTSSPPSGGKPSAAKPTGPTLPGPTSKQAQSSGKRKSGKAAPSKAKSKGKK